MNFAKAEASLFEGSIPATKVNDLHLSRDDGSALETWGLSSEKIGDRIVMDFAKADASLIENATPAPEANDVHIFPMTLAQRWFWDHDSEDPGNPAYNIAVRMRLTGELDIASMARAANEVVRRHEILRTVFAEDDGVPVQIVKPELTIPLPVIDLRSLPDDQRVSRCEQLSVEEARNRFAIATGPLIRMKLLRIGDCEHILLVTSHQTVSDSWSSGMISHELGTLYGAFSQGRDSPLPELPIQYGDYAVWHKEWMANHGLDGQLDYWSSQLANLPSLELPTDRPRPTKRTSNGEILSQVLPKKLTERLKDLSHREGCSFFMLSLAALKVLLHRIIDQDDLYVGTITAGRSRVEMEPLIGRFINPLIIRANLAGDPTFLELLAVVREKVLEALENRDIPYESVVEAIARPKDPSRHPVFQVNFVHHREFIRPLELHGVSLSGIPSKSAGAIHDLCFLMVERAEGWRLSCEYNTDVYGTSTIEHMLAQFRSILTEIAENPKRHLSELFDTEAGYRQEGRAPSGSAEPRTTRLCVAPRNEIESKLAEIWLGVTMAENVSVTADFFDEGGHSVLAARLLYRIEEAFGKRLSLGGFLRRSTIEKIAAWISDEERGEAFDSVIPLRTGGTGPTLFLVHDGFGETYLYRNLALRMPEGVAVYGLEPLRRDDCPILHTRIGEMASYYIERMREIQPEGPYAVGGECLGGTLAFEMALQLEAQGDTVRFVALFDAADPRAPRRIQRTAERRWTSFAVEMKQPREGSRLARMSYKTLQAATKIKNVAVYSVLSRMRRFVARSRFLKLRSAIDQGLPVPTESRGLTVGTVCSFALKDYDSTSRLKAPAILFRATTGEGVDEPYVLRHNDPLLGWGRRVETELEVVDMPGGHSSMLQEPHVEVMAERIAACFASIPAESL